MGIRGHIQVKQPTYGNEVLSYYLGNASYDYLTDKDIGIYTPNDDGANSDTWEIEVSAGLKLVIAELRKNPDALVEYAEGDEERDDVKGRASILADFLEEGLKSAEENGYSWIIIDWY